MKTNIIKIAVRIIIISAICFGSSQTANADVFKCVVDGKATYQAMPCKTEKEETALAIKTNDPDAALKARIANEQFENMKVEREYLKAQADAERARAAAALQRSQAAAEAAERATNLRQQQIEIDRDRSEAFEKYLYKEGGMSPTFKR